MNPRIPWATGGTCLLVAAGAFFFLHDKKGDASPASAQESTATPPAAKVEQRPSTQTEPASPSAAPASEAKLSDEQRAAILAKIEEASVTYDPKGLPLLEPYLLHPDPEVRTATLNGMIVLGESGAAPMLRDASKKAPTPKEAVALSEAADYLELPSGSFIPKERTAPGTRVPNAGATAERSRPRLGSKPKGELPSSGGGQKPALPSEK